MKHFLICTVLAIFAVPAFAGTLNSAVSLPTQSHVSAMVRDSAGNIYLGGGSPIDANPGPADKGAFVVKLSSDGSKVIFETMLSGNKTDGVTALALAPDGAILAAGLTNGSFPVTKDAAEAQPAAGSTAFFARLDAAGNVSYASYLTGGLVLAMTTDSAGAAYITGQGVNSTPGALASNGFGYFVVKLDETGKQAWATGGIGGSAIAVDAGRFVYIAGSQQANSPLPVTPGAFQPTAMLSGCGNSGPLGFLCDDQYAAKLDPRATKLIYCTWLTGAYGASPSSLLIDSQGNAILAGVTQSQDYPVTPGAFQTVDFASQPPIAPIVQSPLGTSAGPPYTGYVTKLNATGTGLIFSTYLGGSSEDAVSAAALDAEGNIYVAGPAGSPDFPGVSGLPDGCRPSYVYQAPYFTRLSADGSSLAATQLAYGLVERQEFTFTVPAETALAALDGQGGAAVSFGGSLANLSLSGRTQKFACSTDAADHAPVAQIAPGQLLTLLGENIGEFDATTTQPRNGLLPVSLGDASAVKIHGIPAPILYSSQDQINVQVPYEIAGQTDVKVEIDDANGDLVGTRQFSVAPSQPSAFTSGAGYTACNGMLTASFLAIALNPDGSLNSCANPTAIGSTVTFFVNGPGAKGVTGAITPGPAAPLALPVVISGDAQFVSAESDPGSINSVWAVKVKLTPNPDGGTVQPASFTLTIGGAPLRDPLAAWVK